MAEKDKSPSRNRWTLVSKGIMSFIDKIEAREKQGRSKGRRSMSSRPRPKRRRQAGSPDLARCCGGWRRSKLTGLTVDLVLMSWESDRAGHGHRCSLASSSLLTILRADVIDDSASLEGVFIEPSSIFMETAGLPAIGRRWRARGRGSPRSCKIPAPVTFGMLRSRIRWTARSRRRRASVVCKPDCSMPRPWN